MKSDILFIFKLIAAVISNSELPKAHKDINWKRIYSICAKHNIANIVAYGINNGDYNIPTEQKTLFKKKIFERLTVSEKQNIEINKLLKSFDEHDIQYMPLKGVILQDMYPSKDMRYMADADILIKADNFEAINSIMSDLGYEFDCESKHEYNYTKKPFIHIELHKHLIPSYNEDMYSYFGDGWKLAHPVANTSTRYELSPEDNFIYIFAHFAKHYRDAGVGIKFVIDIWLYLKKHKDIDYEYLHKQLIELQLYEFYKNVIKLSSVWFEDAEIDDITKQMTEFIINSGTFGSNKNQVIAKTIRDYMDNDVSKAEKQKYVKLFFPDIQYMATLFPILNKFSILLPFCWCLRLVNAVFFKRKNFAIHKQRTNNITSDNINNYNDHISNVGLDIYNGRKRK